MSIQSILASLGGDTWGFRKGLAIWPYPPVIIGIPESLFTAEDYRIFARNIEPGDMILSRSNGFFLSNCMIAGSFKHLGIYTGCVAGRKIREHGYIKNPRSLGVDKGYTVNPRVGSYERTVTHAISDGVMTQDLLRVLNHCDEVVVVRPWKTSEEQQSIVDYALQQVGKEYDFIFNSNCSKSLFCTELGVQALRSTGVFPPEQTKLSVSLLGKKGRVTLADSFLIKYPVVCASVSCLEQKIYQHSKFSDILRTKLKTAIQADF